MDDPSDTGERAVRTPELEREGGRRFRLENVTFGGEGLQSGLESSTWQDLLDLSYHGRGA